MEDQIKKLLKQLRLSESTMSTLLGLAVVLVAGALLYNFFSKKPTTDLESLNSLENLSEPTQEPVKPGDVQEGEKPQGLPATHKVVKGETLWKIAEKYYGSGYNFVDIADENKLKSANVIEVDTELTIPNAPARKQTVVAVVVPESQQVIVSVQTIAADTYTVVSTDTLWSIAVRAYGDGYQWPKLYQANKDKIGMNPSKIEKGIELTIPRG